MIAGSPGFCDQRYLPWANSSEVRGLSSSVVIVVWMKTWGKISWLYFSLILFFVVLETRIINLMSVFVYSLENILSQIFSKNAHQAHDALITLQCLSFVCVCVCALVFCCLEKEMSARCNQPMG